MSLMGIDYGGKRIGLAVSTSGVIATPHSVIKAAGDPIGRITAIAVEQEVDTFVVGVAHRPRSTAGEARFHAFAAALRQRSCKLVVLWDETLSTVEAAERLREAGGSASRRNEDIDMYAAAVILQSFLDDQRRSAS